MTRSPIIDHKQKIIRESHRKLLKKESHTNAIHSWQNEVTRLSIERTNGPISIGVFSDNLLGHNRAYALRCPAATRIIYTAKSGFILEKNFKRLAYFFGLCFCFFNKPWPFFLKVSWASMSALGWRGRGEIFLQSWRSRRR